MIRASLQKNAKNERLTKNFDFVESKKNEIFIYQQKVNVRRLKSAQQKRGLRKKSFYIKTAKFAFIFVCLCVFGVSVEGLSSRVDLLEVILNLRVVGRNRSRDSCRCRGRR